MRSDPYSFPVEAFLAGVQDSLQFLIDRLPTGFSGEYPAPDTTLAHQLFQNWSYFGFMDGESIARTPRAVALHPIVALDSLPAMAAGKPDRAALREQAKKLVEPPA